MPRKRQGKWGEVSRTIELTIVSIGQQLNEHNLISIVVCHVQSRWQYKSLGVALHLYICRPMVRSCRAVSNLRIVA